MGTIINDKLHLSNSELEYYINLAQEKGLIDNNQQGIVGCGLDELMKRGRIIRALAAAN